MSDYSMHPDKIIKALQGYIDEANNGVSTTRAEMLMNSVGVILNSENTGMNLFTRPEVYQNIRDLTFKLRDIITINYPELMI